MVKSDIGVARQRRSVGGIKAAVPALVMAFSMAAASAGHATAIYLGTDSYSTANTAILSGPLPNAINVYLTPQVYNANYGTAPGSPNFDLLVFCVDIFHWSGSNLAYDDLLPLATNSGSGAALDTLDAGQITQIGRLTNYGAKLYALNPAANVNKLAAVQGAIWQVANRDALPGLVIDASNNTVDAMIADLAGANYYTTITNDVGAVGQNVRFLKETANYGSANSHQAFVIASVPEPATWAMMIGGFAAAGVALRRSRRVAAPSAC